MFYIPNPWNTKSFTYTPFQTVRTLLLLHLPERRLNAFAVLAADPARTVGAQERVVFQRAEDFGERLIVGLADRVDIEEVDTIPSNEKRV